MKLDKDVPRTVQQSDLAADRIHPIFGDNIYLRARVRVFYLLSLEGTLGSDHKK